MGARTHTLVRCMAHAQPERNRWINVFLWIVSLFQLLTKIGAGIASSRQLSLPHRQQRQIEQTGPVPSISGTTVANNIHCVIEPDSRPISRGHYTRTTDPAIESSSSVLQSTHDETTFYAGSSAVPTRDAGSSHPGPNQEGLKTGAKPATRILFYGADGEGGIFINDLQRLSAAYDTYLGGRRQVEVRIVTGDVGIEFETFFKQTNVSVKDMLIFGASGHGWIGNKFVTISLSLGKGIRIPDILTGINGLPPHCTIEIILDVCYANRDAERAEYGLYKIWPSDELMSSLNIRNSTVRPRVGPKMILWTAAGKHGVAYFMDIKGSYMLSAMRKALRTHGPNLTRRELYGRVVKHLEPLNTTLRTKNKGPQIPVIFSTIANRDHILDGYALQPLLLGDERNEF